MHHGDESVNIPARIAASNPDFLVNTRVQDSLFSDLAKQQYDLSQRDGAKGAAAAPVQDAVHQADRCRLQCTRVLDSAAASFDRQ